MKSINYKCKCGNEMEYLNQFLEDDLLGGTCNIRCCKCGLNTNFNLVKRTVSNAVSLDVLRSYKFQAISEFFTRNSKFDTRICDIFKVKDSIGDYNLTRKILNRIKEDKEGNVYNELSLNITPDTELLIHIRQKKNELIFKEILINQYVYEIEVKQQ